ncbi:MAG: ABC transporter substrate-binding protein [Pirellulales bacterium]
MIRVASLLPAATEIVALLDHEACLVGRSHECDWPPHVEGLPTLTSSNINSTGSSLEIDRDVKASQTASLFQLDEKLLSEIQPDLILTQSACDVCALDTNTVLAAAAKISLPEGRHPDVLTLAPQSVSDLFDDIHAVASKIDREKEAVDAVNDLKKRCNAITSVTKHKPIKEQPNIALVEWLDPPMSAGNWVPEMIRMAGANDALKADAGKSHWIQWPDVAAADPDVVILIPCGFELERVLTEAKTPAVWPHLKDLRATRKGRLFAVDGHHLFNRPGPRLVDSLEVLAELLHPESFQFEATARFAKRIET